MQPTFVPVTPVIVPPEAQTKLEIHTKKIPRQRHFLILFFFTFMWGTFGVDQMYMGFWGKGILKLITLGGFGFWTLTDMIVIMTGTFRDKEGRLTLQAEEYKKFASRTVFWFAIILAVVILVNGILLILGIFQIADSLKSGSTGGLLNSIPGLSGATGGTEQSQVTSLLGQ